MKTAIALVAPPPSVPFVEPVEPARGQIPLPFPGMRPVLPVPVERGDARPIRERSARFMQALVEVLSGERPARQMVTWMDAEVHAGLVRRLRADRGPVARSAPGTRSAARLVSLHVSMPESDVAEVAARMVHRGRSRAIAVRLEPRLSHRGDRVWRCTAVEWA